MNMTVFWDVAPCNLVKIDRRSIGDYCLYRRGFPGLNLGSETDYPDCVFRDFPQSIQANARAGP
jgi:hypothetical protein